MEALIFQPMLCIDVLAFMVARKEHCRENLPLQPDASLTSDQLLSTSTGVGDSGQQLRPHLDPQEGVHEGLSVWVYRRDVVVGHIMLVRVVCAYAA